MMDRTTFKAAIVKELKNHLPEEFAQGEIKVSEIYKTNRKVETLTMELPDKNISPNFNLDDLYKGYELTGDFEGCLDNMARILVESRNQSFDVSMLSDETKFKENVVMQLINTDSNRELLASAPHREFNDCSVVYRLLIQNNRDGVATVLISNDMMKGYNLSEEELFEIARENTKRLMPPVIRPLSEVLMEHMPEEMKDLFGATGAPEMPMFEPEEELWVVTNKTGVNGAVQILYAENLQQIADRVGNDIYILPSSIHECLCVSKNKMNPEELQDMVREVNTGVVNVADRLSNQVYLYDKTARTITMVSDGQNRDVRENLGKVAEKTMEYDLNNIIR